MEEKSRTLVNNSINIDCLDLGSLSIPDISDSTDHCQTPPNTIDRCESGVEISCLQFLMTNTAYESSTDSSRVQDSSVLENRLPFLETECSRLLMAVTSSDVTSAYVKDKDGDTDLHIGIIQRMTSFVMFLISAVPNHEWLNIVNLRLQTPLHLAVITEQIDVVRRLVTSGARVDVCDIHGNTPLHIACRQGHVDIVQCLLNRVYYEETYANKYDISFQRITRDLDRRNSDGHTCLHLAALSTHLRVLELLVSKGADVNRGDGTSGRTILHYAVDTGNRILLHFLLSQRKINISCRTYGGLTPLVMAAGRGFGDIVSILLDHGADVTDINKFDE